MRCDVYELVTPIRYLILLIQYQYNGNQHLVCAIVGPRQYPSAARSFPNRRSLIRDGCGGVRGAGGGDDGAGCGQGRRVVGSQTGEGR